MKNCKISKRKIRQRNPNVKFYVRFAPANEKYRRHLFVQSDKRTLLVRSLQDLSRDTPKWTYWQFNTDGIFLDDDQSTIFEKVMLPDLLLTLQGIDFLILGFGQSGAGKSFTMSGLNTSFTDRGLIPRSLEYLGKAISANNLKVELSITFVEFFQNECLNLLAKPPAKIDVTKLSPRKIKDTEGALELLFYGEVNRKYEKISTHCGFSVFSIHILLMNDSFPNRHQKKSTIHFVESPGIEGFWQLNKSDLCSVSSNMGKFAIDRLSRLAYGAKTQGKVHGLSDSSELLKYIGKSFFFGRVALLGLIKPKMEELRLTLSTLRFGCKVARLHIGQLVQNKTVTAAQIGQTMKNEIEGLQNLIDRSKQLNSKIYLRRIFTQGDAEYIARLIKLYLAEDSKTVTEETLLSTAEPNLLFEELKRQYDVEIDYLKANFPLKTVPSTTELASDQEVFKLVKQVKTRAKIKRSQTIFSPPEAPKPLQEPEQDTAVTTGSSTFKSSPSPEKTTKPEGRKSKTSQGSKKSARKSMSRKSISKKTTQKKSKKHKSSKDSEGDPAMEINEEFLERGRKDRQWLFNEFLRRDKPLAEEKDKIDSLHNDARENKLRGAKNLDELRALLGNTRIRICELQCKRKFINLSPALQTAPKPPDEEEIALLQVETETVAKIRQQLDELITLHSSYLDAESNSALFQDKVNKAFENFCSELYKEPDAQKKATDLDRDVPRQTIAPSSTLATSSEIEFLKMQVSHLRKKLPVDFNS